MVFSRARDQIGSRLPESPGGARSTKRPNVSTSIERALAPLEPEQLSAPVRGPVAKVALKRAGILVLLIKSTKRADHSAGEVNPVARAKLHVTVRGIT